jgi:uncharacterized membrane protein
MWFLGLLIGLIVGGATEGLFGAFSGALLGAIGGAMLKSAMTNPNQSPQALDARIQLLEKRIGQLSQLIEELQAKLSKFEQPPRMHSFPPLSTGQSQKQPNAFEESAPETPPPPTISASSATEPLEPLSAPTPQWELAAPAPDQPPKQPRSAQRIKTTQPEEPSLLSKLFSGNILAKIGVVLLFFGIASALKLAVEHGMFPLEVRLLLGAAAAVAMIIFGRNRVSRPEHRMFGLALQGGGFGILYLLVYFMLARYQMIGHTTAFVLFMLLGVGCVMLAVVEDGMSLAVLGISGAFIAPVLASSGSGNHIALFSYYAILNGFILGVSWFKDWRALNVCGFFFTFVIGMLWGANSYNEARFVSTEMFLILFFAMYSFAPVLFSLFKAPGMKGWSDGAIVFGTPIAAMLSQAVLMRTYEYGLAWSAFIAGVYYLLLWRALLGKKDSAMEFMEKSHLGIAVSLFTLTIPLAFGAQLTSALWALEGAVLIWLGVRQQRWLARIFGAFLQAASGLYFLVSWLNGDIVQAMPVLNNFYVGALILAASGVVSARLLQQASSNALDGASNQRLSSILLLWGWAWWFGAGGAEIHEFASTPHKVALLLSFTAGSVIAFELIGRSLDWRALRLPVLLLTASLPLAALAQHAQTGEVLDGAMLIAFPLAVAVHHWTLARHDKEAFGLLPVTRHLLVFWLVIAVASHELAWISRSLAPGNTLWPLLAWGFTPALCMLLTIGAAKKALWPVAARPGVYLEIGLAPVALLLTLWSVYANFNHHGGGFLSTYIPFMNPFDLTQILVLFAILRWGTTFEEDDVRAKFFPRLVYCLGFIWVSTMAARLGHHWADVPFTVDALFRSLFVQSALSLLWTIAAIALMISATRNLDRARWFLGFTLLAVVGAKLLFVDLANVGTAAWTGSLIAIAVLVLAASYFSPAPPKADS